MSPKSESWRNEYWVSSRGKNMDSEYCEEYWGIGVHQTKYYYDSVKKRKFSLVVICRLTKN